MQTDKRPWGNYTVLFTGEDHQVKRIQVDAGLRFSLQTHAKRAETWIVVSGSGVVTLDTKEIPVKRGTVIEVKVGQAHRMHNTGKGPLVFFEVQFGNYLGEDDIVRLEDDFNRAGSQ